MSGCEKILSIHRGAISRAATFLVAVCAVPLFLPAQDTPLISGGVGFLTSTTGGNTTYIPVLSPVLAAPLGNHLLVESRATLLESFFPKGNGQPGYTSASFKGLSYLQLDYLAAPHATIVAGEFLTPFGTYNERLTPIWTSNFESAPLIFSAGTMGTASSVGGMIRGDAVSTPNVSLSYAGYFSASSKNQQFNAERSAGGRASLFFPQPRLEIGGSYGRRLQDTHENFAGIHLWWEPANVPVKFRSEYAHAPHSEGYWIESEFRLTHDADAPGIRGGFAPVIRWQQTFRSSPDPTDGLPSANTRRPDFGLDYHFPHEVRINASYSRQFSSTGDVNIWETGIVYRFLFPTWRGK
ncbi:MAG TPA: hypothetical protein VKR52_16540 [Terracidiphilus sp.]|nr:hypothetical protein [Terracidiphilus sp.]